MSLDNPLKPLEDALFTLSEHLPFGDGIVYDAFETLREALPKRTIDVLQEYEPERLAEILDLYSGGMPILDMCVFLKMSDVEINLILDHILPYL